MNKIVNKILSAEEKLMPEIHLRQPRFTKSTFEPFTKNKKQETGDSRYTYQNE